MTMTEVRSEAAIKTTTMQPVDMKLEVVVIPVSDVDRAKQFYGDPGKWKKIHAANSDKIPNPDLIHPGLELTIPDV
jgi:hypothetical protein